MSIVLLKRSMTRQPGMEACAEAVSSDLYSMKIMESGVVILNVARESR